MIKAAEDKTYPGAFVAAPADPWGQSMLAVTTHAGYTYRSVFARDSYETFTGLIADGDLASARQMVRSCSTAPSSPTAPSRATRWSTDRSPRTPTACTRSTRTPTRC